MSKRKCLAGLLALALCTASLAPTVSAESLWNNPNGYPAKSPFADHRASSIGDIVTIVINESTTTSATRSSANEKSGSVKLGAGIGKRIGQVQCQRLRLILQSRCGQRHRHDCRYYAGGQLHP